MRAIPQLAWAHLNLIHFSKSLLLLNDLKRVTYCSFVYSLLSCILTGIFYFSLYYNSIFCLCGKIKKVKRTRSPIKEFLYSQNPVGWWELL